MLRQNVPGALAFVLDSWHEVQRLHKQAGLLHPGAGTAAAAWVEWAEGSLWERCGRRRRPIRSWQRH